MILTGKKINKLVKKGKIIVEPFDERNITTNSYDITLGEKIIIYTEEVLDPKKDNPYKEIIITDKGYKMEKGDFILGSSKEKIGSNFFVPIIHAKSGIARQGLFVHCSTGLVDIGSIGNVTFQFYSTLPIILYPGMKIAQVSFWKTDGKIDLYNGKYRNIDGPIPSKSFEDFKV